MERKDWLAPLLAVTIGALAALGGGWLSDYLHERAATRQAQVALAKQLAADRATELKALKDAGLRYMSATDALVNAVALGSSKDKAVSDHFARVQSAGNDLVLIADEELARQTVALNQRLAGLVSANPKTMDDSLTQINAQLLDWIKQLKRDMDSLKTRSEDASLGSFKASTQVVAQLKR